MSWRIEINRRKGKTAVTHHWIWRLTMQDGARRAKYGGSLATLPDQQRWKQYRRNSARYKRRNKQDDKTT